MKPDRKDARSFTVRLTEELWKFLKIQSAEMDVSMQHIIRKCIRQFKKEVEEEK